MEMGPKILELAKKNIDVPGLVDGILDEVLEAALYEAVKKSETLIDDVVVGALYPTLESVVKAKVREAWLKL